MHMRCACNYMICCFHLATILTPHSSTCALSFLTQSFYSEFGHYNIDFRFDQNQNIGGWCAQISRQYKDWQDGKTAIHPTTENQFNQLSAIGFQFNVFAPAKRDRRSWDENFNAFVSNSMYVRS